MGLETMLAGISEQDIPIYTQGLGTLANIYGQWQANKAQKKLDAFNDQRARDIGTALKTSQNSNYLDSAAAKGFLNIIDKNMKEAGKSITNSAIQGGATPETVIAAEGKMQDKYQNAVNNMLNAGQAIKDRDRMFYESQQSHMDDIKANSLAGKVAQWQNFGNNVTGSTSNIMNAWANNSFTSDSTGPQGSKDMSTWSPGDSYFDDIKEP